MAGPQTRPMSTNMLNAGNSPNERPAARCSEIHQYLNERKLSSRVVQVYYVFNHCLGAVNSVGMEVIQQAPFLPLTKSLVETIAALNENKLTATQESIAEYLAKTYQYVHVPKLNVIHNCLGILIKERTIYHTGNGYFVSATHNSYGTPSEALKQNGVVNNAKDQRRVSCEVSSKGKPANSDNGRKTNKSKGKEGGKKKRNEKNKCLKKKEESSELKSLGVDVEKRQLEERKNSESKILANREEKFNSPSETASVSSGDGTKNKTKKPKKGMLNQISCFIKGKTSTAEISEGAKEEQIQTPPPLGQCVKETTAQQYAPLAVPEVESPELVKNERSVHFRHNRTISAPEGTRYTHETESGKAPVVFRSKRPETDPLSYQEPMSSVTRNRSFVGSSVNRPKPVMRSNSFTAARTTTRQPADMAQGSCEAYMRRLNYGDIIRNNPARRTVHVSRPSSFNIGIVRPLDTNQPLYHSNSVKKESVRMKAASLSPSSTPRLKEKVAGHRGLTVVRSKSFTEPTSSRTMNQSSRRSTIGPFYPDSTLQQLLKTPTAHVTPTSPKVRITVPSKGKACAPFKLQAPKKTPPNSPVRKQQRKPAVSPDFATNREITQLTIDNCSSPICYDTSTMKVKGNSLKRNLEVVNDQTKLTPPYLPADHSEVNQRYCALPSTCASSDHIVIEELTSSAPSSKGSLSDDNCAEHQSKPLGKFKKISDEGVNDSLTFIGII